MASIKGKVIELEKCEECNGTGKLPARMFCCGRASGFFQAHFFEVDCWKCNGTGLKAYVKADL